LLLVSAETGIIPDRLIKTQTDEPAEQDIEMDLLYQLDVARN